jgi:hypothetical protein
VITTAPVLATLAQLVSEGEADVAGCIDEPQVRGVIYTRSGELSAENMLEIEDAALADRFAAYVDSVRGRYPRFVLEQPRLA